MQIAKDKNPDGKNPKIKFTDYLVSRTDSSQYAGSIYVNDYCDGYLGRIEKDTGRFTKGHDFAFTTDKIKKHLMEFALDPIKLSIEHGRRTGNCCYCGKDLTQEQSLAAGYGEKCAQNYNLPWGDNGSS